MNKEELVNACNRFDGNEAEFSRILYNFILLSKPKELYNLAGQLEVPPITLARWAQGFFRPHPEIQKFTVQFVKRELARK